MRIGQLEDITLVSSDVAGSTYDEYVAGTTYSATDNVKVSFESDGTTPLTPVNEYTAIDGSTGSYPPDNPTHWTDGGADNKWAMFDGYVNTQTENTTSMEVVIDSSGSNIIGLFDLVAKSITFELTAYSEVKMSETIDMTTMSESSWYSYFNSTVDFRPSTLWSFASYAASTLKITIEYYTGSAAKCGMVSMGKQVDVGVSYYAPTIELLNYGIWETDTLGRSYLNPGNNAKQIDVEFWMDNSQLASVLKNLIAVLNVPAIFDCNNDTDLSILSVYGSYKGAAITIPGPTQSKCVLTIIGLT